jgi:hypothetical protein
MGDLLRVVMLAGWPLTLAAVAFSPALLGEARWSRRTVIGLTAIAVVFVWGAFGIPGAGGRHVIGMAVGAAFLVLSFAEWCNRPLMVTLGVMGILAVGAVHWSGWRLDAAVHREHLARFSAVRAGMGEQQVSDLLGSPARVSRRDGRIRWQYFGPPASGWPTPATLPGYRLEVVFSNKQHVVISSDLVD